MIGQSNDCVWMSVNVQVECRVSKCGEATLQVPRSELGADGQPSKDWVRMNFPDEDLLIDDCDEFDSDGSSYQFQCELSTQPVFEKGNRVRIARDRSRYHGDYGYVHYVALQGSRPVAVRLDRKKCNGQPIVYKCAHNELRGT